MQKAVRRLSVTADILAEVLIEIMTEISSEIGDEETASTSLLILRAFRKSENSEFFGPEFNESWHEL